MKEEEEEEMDGEEVVMVGEGEEERREVEGEKEEVENESGVVYIGSHSHSVLAVRVDSGEVVWRTVVGDRVEASACPSSCGHFIVVGMTSSLCHHYKNTIVYSMPPS